MLVSFAGSWGSLLMVCTLLTYTSLLFSLQGSYAIKSNWNIEGGGVTFLTGLNCSGAEENVLDCPVDNTAPVCPSADDANVLCPGILNKLYVIMHAKFFRSWFNLF